MYTFIMGDALIVGRGGGGSSSSKYELKTEIYEVDKLWVVPKAKNQKFSVRIFGGGGGSNLGSGGGGGGFMNNGDLTLSQGSTVQITIGLGGLNGQDSTTGGITSFGTYLSANGGTGPTYLGSSIPGDEGGNGGSGGGGTCMDGKGIHGGIGYQFGGGGCGGDGGYWGGGGGAAITRANSRWGSQPVNYTNGGQSINYQYNTSNGQWYDGGGGGKGGNGAMISISTSNSQNRYIGIVAEMGIDTTSILSDISLSGKGLGGNNSIYKPYGVSFNAHLGGGGGGYGGNGGNNAGGGGGYGANGGDGITNQIESSNVRIAGGGGGGYGKGGHGGNAGRYQSGYKWPVSGGGGAYGPGGDAFFNGVRGGGAGGSTSSSLGDGVEGSNGPKSGGNGICIIQYYA